MNEQMQADVLLGTQLTCSNLKTGGSPAAILLSGATGFLGAFLLQELLTRRKAAKVICLVRAQDDDEAMSRLGAARRSYGMNTVRSGQVDAIAADVSQPSLGLAPHRFEELAASADTIIHAAAHVNLVLPYRIMRRSNVLGTYEMLRLCSTGVKKSFHLVSSVAAIGSAAPTRQEDFVIPASDAVSGYAQSKWVSEQLVVSAADKGLHASIYRPGLITGHSKTGVWHKRDALSLKLLACMRLRVAPTGKEEICMTPIDHVCTAIEQLTARSDGGGKAFHLVNRCAVSWEQITSALVAGKYVDRTVPHSDWLLQLRARLHAFPQDEDLARAASLFSMINPSGKADTSPHIDDTNTRHALRINREGSCLCTAADLLPIYFKWMSAQTQTYPPRQPLLPAAIAKEYSPPPRLTSPRNSPNTDVEKL